jgi:hypothetical protein
MRTEVKIELSVSGLGLGLTVLGVLVPGCFALVFIGALSSAVAFGMLIRAAVGGMADTGEKETRPPGAAAA